jgi:hypothetical protein
MIKLSVALRMGAALCLATILAQSVAQGAELSGSFGSGGNTGNASASLGGGSMSSTGSAAGPSGTTGSGSLSIGGGSGIGANSSSGTTNNTSSNFTASLGGGSGTNGSTNFSSGDTGFGFSFGQPGLLGPGAAPGAGSGVPGISGTNLSGIAAAIGDLSTDDKRQLVKKCVSVLAAPNRHDPDMVNVCKVLASL